MPALRKHRKGDWFGGYLGCRPGSVHNCFIAHFLQADDSPFFNQDLRDATEIMNRLCSTLRRKAPDDRELRIINTGVGLMLVYAKIVAEPDTSQVNYDSSADDIVADLKIQDGN
jgi:hypothetical protein